LVSVANAGGNDGTGLVIAMVEAPLVGGIDPVIVSTGTSVKAQIDGNAPATALVSVANAGGNDGTGLVIAMAEAPLVGGIDPLIVSTGTSVKAQVDGNAPAAALVTVSNKTGNDGTGLVIALIETALTGGLEPAITSTGDSIKATLLLDAEASLFVTAVDGGGNDGTGVVTALGVQSFTGGGVGSNPNVTAAQIKDAINEDAQASALIRAEFKGSQTGVGIPAAIGAALELVGGSIGLDYRSRRLASKLIRYSKLPTGAGV
jgi:hypothetical protein